MAEAILYNVANEIIKILGSGALQQIGIWWGVNDELKKLENTVSTIQAVLLDAEHRQTQDLQIKDWLRKLQDVVYDADDLLDDFYTEALIRKVKSGNKITKQVRLFFSRSNRIVYDYKMGRKIKELRERLDDIATDSQKFQLVRRLVTETLLLTRPQTHSFVGEGEVIGRDKDKNAILGLLLDSNSSENVLIIPIVGMGGLGKTALAQFVYNDERVKNHFELKLWVCVSDPFEVKLVIEKILKSLFPDWKPENLELDQLQSRLRKGIDGKKYLLVLDDVWNEDRNIWLELKKLLICGARGSRIIVTTRSETVARVTSRLSPHVLKGLSLEESWSLFTKIVFEGQESKTDSSNLIQIGKEIVRKCGGVPLAIKTIGRLLYSKNSDTHWLPFLENEFSTISQNENDILPTLQLGYNNLPPHLKHCFAYCSLFPKDYEIDVEALIQLWIAQGFVKSSETSLCLEKLGLEYFEDLLWRSFFQEVEYDGSQSIVSYKMHDLMHDLATLAAGSESTISNPNADNVGEKTRHVSLDFNIDGSWQVPSHFYNALNLRTFLLPRQKVWDIKKSEWEIIFSKFKRLRVFDLNDTYIKKVPDFIKKLKHLRYLDFSKSKISVLPSSICCLQNLQVLKLSYCYELKELPIGITKLLNLRCLDCYGCDSLTHMPRGIEKLTSLQTLTYFVVAENNSSHEKVGGLDELKRLNGLTGSLEIGRLHFPRNPQLECEAANLKEKQHLRSLTLSWDPKVVGNPSETENDEVSLESLQPHPNIKKLSIYHYVGLKFPVWFSSHTNFVDLTLLNCRNCKHLPQLSLIPSLKSLLIGHCPKLEYIERKDDNNFSGARGQGGEGRSTFFPSLKDLFLSNCPQLMGWWKKNDDDDAVAESVTVLPQFSCLSKLTIGGCPLLTWMPLFPSLEEELRLSHVSSKLLQQIMTMNTITSASSSPSSAVTLSFPSSSSNSIVQPLSKLKCLKLKQIYELESLREEWLRNLICLKDLRIIDCGQLRYLPQNIQCLTTLSITNCPFLTEKCRNNKGEDWPIIERIPNIKINGRKIQREGHYQCHCIWTRHRQKLASYKLRILCFRILVCV
ncbi:hypothetical protein K2173_024788 [Erythroxylum novogranatense]|uniref:Disease resistance protein RGA3 n=1 Tax=Erythroxylum novogranatense TaxID=1862640 RepID=A0AAV8UF30_9ROSI|nr:hypothetical protein K2173_024788 [Erythroxylum novogranatense]